MKKSWQDKEKKDAKSFGGVQTPRSGGLWFAKGDSRSEKFLIDSKTSIKERFSITSKMWDKIYKEALMESKMPILSVEFGEKKTEVVVLDKNDFEVLMK